VRVDSLSADERDLLSQVVAKRGSDPPRLLGELDRGERLSADNAERLRTAIGEELMATGITGGEINGRGMKLDNLIDTVGRLTYLFDT
jgi:hypothetical protein